MLRQGGHSVHGIKKVEMAILLSLCSAKACVSLCVITAAQAGLVWRRLLGDGFHQRMGL